ncbi:MAG: hypothetical protein AVDCRST_MAG21-883, partial [uncultured Nocardioidaceae bacterium]
GQVDSRRYPFRRAPPADRPRGRRGPRRGRLAGQCRNRTEKPVARRAACPAGHLELPADPRVRGL